MCDRSDRSDYIVAKDRSDERVDLAVEYNFGE
jgi:hypothetical protein